MSAGRRSATPLANRRRLAGAAVLALLGAVVLAVWATGATEPPVLGDPGATVRWGLPVIVGLSRAAAALAVGALVLCITVLPRADEAAPTWARVRDVATFAAAAWAVLQGGQLLLTFLDVMGGWPETEVLLHFTTFLDLSIGRSLAAATLTTGLVAVAALLARGPGEALIALLDEVRLSLRQFFAAQCKAVTRCLGLIERSQGLAFHLGRFVCSPLAGDERTL